ncbi:MAG TPA: hypothetical protein VJ020_05530 [Anaerolineales bacterium]|nr:hypothetical protein [Anaerolineales bacterium]
MIQKSQTQLEQAQIAAMPAMDFRRPPVLVRHSAQVDNPQVGEAGGQDQPHHASRVAQMAVGQVKPSAFLVGKERFNPHLLRSWGSTL